MGEKIYEKKKYHYFSFLVVTPPKLILPSTQVKIFYMPYLKIKKLTDIDT